MESLYRIVFAGELAPGRRPQEVIEAFAARFQVSEERTRDLILGGERLVLKHDLNRTRAVRYRNALAEAGLVVTVESQDGSGLGTLEEADENPPSSQAPESEVHLSEAVVGPTLREAPQSAFVSNDRDVAMDSAPCPKCGARQVSQLTGVCQACGVVVERYLARRAAERGEPAPANPYAPPKADLAPPPARMTDDAFGEPRGVSAGRGWGWIAAAWPMFAAQPWTWIGTILLLMVVYFVLGLVPVVGGLAPTLLGPAFTGGLAIGAHTQRQGERFQIEHLFAGFSRNPSGLLLLGLAALGLFLAVMLTMVLAMTLAGGAFGLSLGPAMDPAQIEAQVEAMGPAILLAGLLGLLLMVPVAMALFFAPYLVALNGVPVLASLKLSFQGCWRNILPFLVFGLIAMALAFATVLTLGFGMLVLIPVLTLAMYLAFREIYYDR